MRVTLLLAEDDPAQRWIFSKVLRGPASTCWPRPTGPRLAVAAAHAGPIELLVSDVRMPRVGGFELADRLRLERPGLKVLFVSGDSDAPPAGEPLLAKPFAHADLAATAWAVLGGQGPCEARAAVAWGGTAHPRPTGVLMTTRQDVMKATPGGGARFVQPEAHAAEAYLRQAHWEVCGPGLARPCSAWASAKRPRGPTPPAAGCAARPADAGRPPARRPSGREDVPGRPEYHSAWRTGGGRVVAPAWAALSRPTALSRPPSPFWAAARARRPLSAAGPGAAERGEKRAARSPGGPRRLPRHDFAAFPARERVLLPPESRGRVRADRIATPDGAGRGVATREGARRWRRRSPARRGRAPDREGAVVEVPLLLERGRHSGAGAGGPQAGADRRSAPAHRLVRDFLGATPDASRLGDLGVAGRPRQGGGGGARSRHQPQAR